MAGLKTGGWQVRTSGGWQVRTSGAGPGPEFGARTRAGRRSAGEGDREAGQRVKVTGTPPKVTTRRPSAAKDHVRVPP
ncbi:hypothetical protein GCM10010176_039420 [Nonomuraea spiralis]|nr:hypothetical protein GCM10010176_039420 [Nonomuraea spiralis]